MSSLVYNLLKRCLHYAVKCNFHHKRDKKIFFAIDESDYNADNRTNQPAFGPCNAHFQIELFLYFLRIFFSNICCVYG